MEIKKYVLLEDKTIQKCNEDKMYITGDNYLAMNSGMIIDKVLKTSDNILALAEENDFIEYVRKNGGIDRSFIKNAVIIEHENGCIQDGGNIHGIYEDYNEKMYLYKKQPNGDYKQYEVEKWQ